MFQAFINFLPTTIARPIGISGLAGLTLLLAGCETPQVASVIDPAYAGAPRQALTIIVAGPKEGLIVRQAAETAALKQFAARGVRAIPSLTLIPATQEETQEDELAIFRDADADAALMIAQFSRDTHTGKTPVHYTPGFWRSHVFTDKNGNRRIYREYEPGYYSGGHHYTRTIAQYQARLIDLKSGDVMWRGDVDLIGGADYADIAAEAAQALTDRLMLDGFVTVTPAD